MGIANFIPGNVPVFIINYLTLAQDALPFLNVPPSPQMIISVKKERRLLGRMSIRQY